MFSYFSKLQQSGPKLINLQINLTIIQSLNKMSNNYEKISLCNFPEPEVTSSNASFVPPTVRNPQTLHLRWSITRTGEKLTVMNNPIVKIFGN